MFLTAIGTRILLASGGAALQDAEKANRAADERRCTRIRKMQSLFSIGVDLRLSAAG
jgi:hypothetical protein